MADLQLNALQAQALKNLKDGSQNFFLTGGAGTGKSTVIRQFLAEKIASRKQFPVLASTGAAAILIGGRTFHSFFGLGIMQGGPQAVYEKAMGNKRLLKRLRDVEGIILDEVSMLSGQTLDCAERIARGARVSNLAWGGIRILAVGDFFQLPPVTRDRVRDWGFESNAWEDSEFEVLELDEVMRTGDEDYLRVLNKIRFGLCDDDVRDFLDSRIWEEADPEITHLFSRRDRTDAFNQGRLAGIDADLHEIPTRYDGDPRYVETLAREAPIPPVLELKVGAFVMIRVNDPKQRFVNGSTGRIRRIYDESLLIDGEDGRTWEVEPFPFSYLDAEGKEVAHAINFPVSLAYASTIHKIQGATLSKVHVDLGQIWEPGQSYVALSRVRKSSDLSLMRWSESAIQADPKVRAFYASRRAHEDKATSSRIHE